MTDCERLSDRMPEVARGASAWSASEASHLSSCPDCQAELRLVRTAAGLGELVARRVDTSRLASQVMARIRSGDQTVRPIQAWSRRLALPLAMAATLALVVWTSGPGGNAPAAAAETVTALLHELDDLDASELEGVLDAVGAPATDSYRPIDATESLGDLTDAELEAVLTTLEG